MPTSPNPWRGPSFMNWFASIIARFSKPVQTPVFPRIDKCLAAIARAEIGVEEVNGTNCGPRVNQYKAATNLPPEEPWPWCAAFVCWVVREALKKCGIRETKTFKRPTTAGAWALINWSWEQDKTTWTKRNPGNDIQPGDIIIYKFSHCGIADGAPNAQGYFRCIEGNTNDSGDREGGAVLSKTRHISQVRARIRFPQTNES